MSPKSTPSKKSSGSRTRVVADHQAIEQAGATQHPARLHLNRVTRQLDRVALHAQIRISQVDPELSFVIAQVRIKEIGRSTVDPKLEAAQIARVAMEESERLEWRLKNVAADVEDRETPPVGKHAHDSARRQRRSQHIK